MTTTRSRTQTRTATAKLIPEVQLILVLTRGLSLAIGLRRIVVLLSARLLPDKEASIFGSALQQDQCIIFGDTGMPPRVLGPAQVLRLCEAIRVQYHGVHVEERSGVVVL